MDYQCDTCEVPYPHLHIIPMSEVLDFDSSDSWDGCTVADVLDEKRSDSSMCDALRELIERDGFQAGFAIAVSYPAYVSDGHHRLAVLYDMGANWCPVQVYATHGEDTKAYEDSKRRYRRAKYANA